MTDREDNYEFQITVDPGILTELYGNPPELVKQFEELYRESEEAKDDKIIHKLTKLISKYPNSPQLKNFLSATYNKLNQYDKAIEINNRIISEHPDYLIAKINRAHELMSAERYDEIPLVLGEELELKHLYPHRDIFHISEVLSFYLAAIRYFALINDLDSMESRYELIRQIDPHGPETKSALELIELVRKFLRENNNDPESATRNSKYSNNDKIIETYIYPVFVHAEIRDLYHNDFNIKSGLLKKICSLPRKTLIHDLEAILKDAENRFEYFLNQAEEDGTHHAPLHALFILAEIKAAESLPTIIAFFSGDIAFLNFWLDDHLTESVWLTFYHTGSEQLNVLNDLIHAPEIHEYVKTAATAALCQLALHVPSKRKEVYHLFNQLLSEFYNTPEEDIDIELASLILCDALDAEFFELLPLVKQLYEKGFVDIEVCGPYQEFEDTYLKEKYSAKKKLLSISAFYQYIIDTWYKEEKDITSPAPTLRDFNRLPKINPESKIGRNDPCPCGSGKKYKKCHGV
jgi:hypothetical protein